MPVRFQIVQSNETIISNAGLAIVGQILQKTYLGKNLNNSRLEEAKFPDISHKDVVFAFLGLLCQGKTDFENIEAYRDDEFYRLALGIRYVPSSATLRQRLEAVCGKWRPLLLQAVQEILNKAGVQLIPCSTGHIPLDIDVSPFENSKSQKEGTSLTYKKVVGYSPVFAYLGEEGYCINLQLKEGSTHCQKGMPDFLKETVTQAKKVTSKPLLVRMDSGNDSADNIEILTSEDYYADFIIKRNLRREPVEDWIILAQNEGKEHLLDGITIYKGDTIRKIKVGKTEKEIRMIYQVTKTTVDKHGQILIVPDFKVDVFMTSLDCTPRDIITLYEEHGTSEQFHSEFKSDMDLEQLPSGKFDVNALVLELGMVAYNILKIIGMQSMKKDTPLKRSGQRRRLKTVIKNMVTMAAKVVSHARSWFLKIGHGNKWFSVFEQLYHEFAI